jgi:hypothetical protein
MGPQRWALRLPSGAADDGAVVGRKAKLGPPPATATPRLRHSPRLGAKTWIGCRCGSGLSAERPVERGARTEPCERSAGNSGGAFGRGAGGRNWLPKRFDGQPTCAVVTSPAC